MSGTYTRSAAKSKADALLEAVEAPCLVRPVSGCSLECLVARTENTVVPRGRRRVGARAWPGQITMLGSVRTALLVTARRGQALAPYLSPVALSAGIETTSAVVAYRRSGGPNSVIGVARACELGSLRDAIRQPDRPEPRPAATRPR